MRNRRLFCALLAGWLLTCSLAAKALGAPEAGVSDGRVPAGLSAQSAVLLESETGRVLYEKNASQKAYMASTTKVMTALLAVESGDLDALVSVPDTAVGVEGSNVYLARGEHISLRDLLYGLMLVSGNDAAVTIAEHIDGGVEEFCAHMNARAEAIGCTGTNFANPNGLPDENHYTTALDLGRIAAEAMQNETFRELVGTTYHQTTTGDLTRTFKNKNKILWQYAGGNGVKTGFTKAAGRCLVFSAERGGMTLVGVVLHASDMWDDATALLDYGFNTVENRRLVDASLPLAQIEVANGTAEQLPVYAAADVSYPLMKNGSDSVSFALDCEETLAAPVRAGDAVGALTLLVNGEKTHSVPLVVKETVQRARLLDRLDRLLHELFA